MQRNCFEYAWIKRFSLLCSELNHYTEGENFSLWKGFGAGLLISVVELWELSRETSFLKLIPFCRTRFCVVSYTEAKNFAQFSPLKGDKGFIIIFILILIFAQKILNKYLYVWILQMGGPNKAMLSKTGNVIVHFLLIWFSFPVFVKLIDYFSALSHQVNLKFWTNTHMCGPYKIKPSKTGNVIVHFL